MYYMTQLYASVSASFSEVMKLALYANGPQIVHSGRYLCCLCLWLSVSNDDKITGTFCSDFRKNEIISLGPFCILITLKLVASRGTCWPDRGQIWFGSTSRGFPSPPCFSNPFVLSLPVPTFLSLSLGQVKTCVEVLSNTRVC